MAELKLFHSNSGNSIVHRMDERRKLFLLILYSLAITNTNWMGYLLISFFLVIFYLIAEISLPVLVKQLKLFVVFILMVILLRSFSGEGQPVFSAWSGGPTVPGAVEGLLFGWKLVLIVLVSALFTHTTRISGLNKAVQWFLKPIPFIPEVRVGTMISLVVSLFPLVFHQASEVNDALKARGGERVKNPLKRIRLFVIPTMIRTMQKADNISLAMESRCYSEKSRVLRFNQSSAGNVALLIAGLCPLYVLVINFIPFKIFR